MKILEVKDYNHMPPINRYAITWEINTLCNYDCDYCDLYGKEVSHNTDKVVEFINYVGTLKNVKLTLFGGEPSLHPLILTVLSNLKVKVEMYTNLSKSLSFYDKVIKIKPDIELETSFHPSREKFDTFYDKVKYLSNKVSKLEIVYMLDTNYLTYKQDYLKIKELCSDSVSSIIAKVEHSDQKQLSEEDEAWYLEEQSGEDITIAYEDNGETKTKETISNYLFANSLNHFKYFMCGCGVHNIFIAHDGLVYPCLDYRRRSVDPYFGIHEDDFKKEFKRISTKGIVCKMNSCSSELGVPKKRVLNV